MRHSSPWLGPRHGKTHAHFDQDAVLCSFQNGDGQHVVLLAVTADNSVESVLQSTDSGGVQLHVSTHRRPFRPNLVILTARRLGATAR